MFLPLDKENTSAYTTGMADKLTPVTFRPRPETLVALEKIVLFLSDGVFKASQNRAIEKAIIEYAKTLSESPKVDAPLTVE